MIMKDRSFNLKEGPVPEKGPVVYWMSRDQRVSDNWALESAQKKALELKRSLAVVFCLVDHFLEATLRQYGFMLQGLEEVEATLRGKGIAFIMLRGEPDREIPRFIDRVRASWLYCDFDPLRIKRRWTAAVADHTAVPFTEVDTHNIVPCRAASPRQEWAAYTFRPKVTGLLDAYLETPPGIVKHPHPWPLRTAAVDWSAVRSGLKVDRSVTEVSWLRPGEKAARQALRSFIRKRLSRYGERKAVPGSNVQSDLSPYLHFGQLSAARVVREIRESGQKGEAVENFLEELIVRRELADNFCFYNADYDSFAGFPDWSRKTLDRHRVDRRPYLYSFADLENASTHDDLWNAAQAEMVLRGKMHGYLRMYWAKKILEWTPSPDQALKIAARLNDRYELDGRDPNGYTGIAWSMGGVHDRAWGERPIFGKVRYMADSGVRRKFDVNGYLEKWGRR